MKCIKYIYSINPKILTIDNFLSEEECKHFINLSTNKLKDAMIIGDGGDIKLTSDRNNRNCWVDHNTDSITSDVCSRISKLVNMPIENAEKYQIIHYAKNQKYNYHYDGLALNDSEKTKNFLKNGGQRMITALVYLNNVEKGGETGFRNLDIKINPKMGRIVIFENCYKNTNDPHNDSLHSGLPVLEGEKYAFNLWFREIGYNVKYNFDLIKKFKKSEMRLKTGIISTMGNPCNLETWVEYHINRVKIDNIIIFHDSEIFPEVRHKIEKNLLKFKNVIILDSYKNEKFIIKKQEENFKRGVEIAKELELDFIFHIDDDELIYGNEINNILLEHYDKRNSLHFENLEVLKTSTKTSLYNFFEEEKFYKTRESGDYNSYFNGKAGGFTSTVRWNGCHELLNGKNKSVNESRIKILHYPFMIYKNWKNKLNIIDSINKLNFPFHNKSLELIKKYRDKNETKLQEEYLSLLNPKDNIYNLLRLKKIKKIEFKNN